MIVQEAGVAIGWPLGLGHDTTGWPLGLRLRLTQEELQWPRNLDLIRSPSYTSEDSSGFDTMVSSAAVDQMVSIFMTVNCVAESTRSFFQDKSITLGTLMGLQSFPSMDHPINSHHQQQEEQHDPAFPSLTTAMASTSTGSGVRQFGTRKANTTPSPSLSSSPRARNHDHHDDDQGCSSRKQKEDHPAGPGNPPAGWNLLSVLTCARAPAEIGVNECSSIPRSQLHQRVQKAHCPRGLVVQDSEVELQQDPELLHNNFTAAATLTQLAMQLPKFSSVLQRELKSPSHARNSKLYDNITFEDDVVEQNICNTLNRSGGSSVNDSPNSKELNPLFTCSPLEAQDEDKFDEKYESSAETTTDHNESLPLSQIMHRATSSVAAALAKSNSDDDSGGQYSSLRSRLKTSDSLHLRDQNQEQQPRLQLVEEESKHLHTSNDVDYCDSQVVSQSDQMFSKHKAISLFISRMRLNRKMRTSRLDGAWLKTCIGSFTHCSCRSLWESIFHTSSIPAAADVPRNKGTYQAVLTFPTRP